MRARLAQPRRAVGTVNVTPLIDVVMCMIIFYLIVGRLASSQHVHDLPKTTVGATDASGASLTVDISPGPGGAALLYIDGREVDLAGLEGAARAAAAERAGPRAVLLRAPRSLPYSTLAPILDALRSAGLTSVRLGAEKSR